MPGFEGVVAVGARIPWGMATAVMSLETLALRAMLAARGTARRK